MWRENAEASARCTAACRAGETPRSAWRKGQRDCLTPAYDGQYLCPSRKFLGSTGPLLRGTGRSLRLGGRESVRQRGVHGARLTGWILGLDQCIGPGTRQSERTGFASGPRWLNGDTRWNGLIRLFRSLTGDGGQHQSSEENQRAATREMHEHGSAVVSARKPGYRIDDIESVHFAQAAARSRRPITWRPAHPSRKLSTSPFLAARAASRAASGVSASAVMCPIFRPGLASRFP
jgi:hypothetical protein